MSRQSIRPPCKERIEFRRRSLRLFGDMARAGSSSGICYMDSLCHPALIGLTGREPIASCLCLEVE